MVAIISGMQAGLNLSSRELLGQSGASGNAQAGRNGQGVYVNAAKGLLVVQNQDEYLAARGLDAGLLRTYNSKGSLNDDNGDGWLAGMRMLQVAGTVGDVGSTVTRIDADGSSAVYSWDAARSLYVTTDGAGAHDTIEYVGADGQFEWRDGATGATQRYEGSGAYRLLLASDTSGNVQTYAYGANGFLSSVTTASGDITEYDYSGNNLTEVRTVADGVTTTRVRYAYDASDRLSTVTVDLTPSDGSIADGNVYQTTYTYDGASKRIAGITQSDGTSLAFTYVDLGGGDWRVATVTDGLNQTTSFTYAAGYTTVTDALGLVTRYDYDASSQLTKITAPAVGGVSPTRQFAYNASGDVVSVTDGEGRTVSYEYDANGNQVLQRDQAGNTVTRTFDARNQLLTETAYVQPDADGAGAAQPGQPLTTRYVYDATGRNLLRFTLSAEGRVTEYRYNAFGEQVAAITYAAGQYPVSALAPTDALSEADLTTWVGTQNLAATQRVDFTYDGRGLMATRTAHERVTATGEGVADGTETVHQYIYDQAGLLLQTVDGNNAETFYSYDGLGRVLTVTNALQQTTVTQYSDSQNRTTVTLANGLMTTSAFDAAGRLVSVLQSSAAGTLGETRYFYDAGNRLRMTQDPTGVRNWVLYDAAGRKSAVVDGNGTMTEYSYDAAGLVTREMRWGTAVNTALLVDSGGLPIASATADTVRPGASGADAALWRQYDSAGRLVREARSTAAALAAVTEYSYDGASRLVRTVQYANAVAAGSVAPGSVPQPSASAMDRVARNFHDADGRLVGSLDAEGYLTTYAYTAAGQLAETVQYATATTESLRAAGELSQLVPLATADDIRTVNFYDGKGQRIAQVDGEGYYTEYGWDTGGNNYVTVRCVNRVSGPVTVDSDPYALRPDWDPQDRFTLRDFDPLHRVVSETSHDLIRTEYTYDTVGNLVSTVRAVATSEVRTTRAAYDLQGRLIGELSAEGAALLTGGQTQAEVDAIWAQHGLRHTYDAASRRTSTTDAAGNRTLFFYDADGALTHTVNALGEVRESRYDARGRVIEQIRYADRIDAGELAGLQGGLVSNALLLAIDGIANATVDSRVTYTYNRDGTLASTTDEVGSLTTQAYNAFGEAIDRQVTGTGVSLSESYAVDRRGQRTSTLQDAGGLNVLSSAVYDAFGRLVRSTDGNGNVREQSFDRIGRVLTTRDPLNALRSTSYDAFSRVLSETDALGNVTSYTYDDMARTMTVTTPEGISSVTAYNSHGQTQSITDGKGNVTSYTYDRNGQLKATSTPLTTSSSAYDGAGRLVETVDAAGNKVTYTYDAANRVLTRRVDPDGLNLTTAYAYDGKGQQVSVTDPNGVVRTRQFDKKGSVLRETVDPTGLNLQTVYTYDARGNVLTVTSPGGTVTQYVYDALGRRTQERVDPAGLNLTRGWTYDANGNAVTSTDGRGNVTRYTYDANDRLVFTVDPLGNVRQNSYDAAGRIVKTVAYATPISMAGLPAVPTAADVQGRIVTQAAQDMVEHRAYDADGRLVTTVDGTGAVTKFVYDANGNVVQRTAYATRIDLSGWTPGTEPAVAADPTRDAKVQTVYDALNRAVYSVSGTGAVVAHTYDGNGNVLQRIAYATALQSEPVMTPENLAATVAAVADPARDAVVRNVYDAAGRLTWTADGTGAVTQRVYDKNGNLVNQVAYATAIAASASPSSVIASAGDRATAMAYDSANRMVMQVDALRGVTEYVYDANGSVARRIQYANAIVSVPALGTAGTLAAIRAAITPDAADRSSVFGYDMAGRQVLAIDALGAVTETQYDAAGSVTAMTAYGTLVNTAALPAVPTLAGMRALVVTNAFTDRTTKSAYDAAGRQAFQVDALGTVTATQYDGIGQVVRTTRHWNAIAAGTANTAAGIAAALVAHANDQTNVFSYNAAGQLTTSTDAMGGTESYTYDALGNKLSFVNKRGFMWTYTYDAAGRMLTETTPQVSLTTVGTDGAGNLVANAPETAAIVTSLAYDALGNLTQRTEALGRPEERTTRYEYDQLGRQVRVIYPAVGVYNAVGDNVAANGATGVADRVETTQVLETRTYYDALGNAVANVDVGGALSQKVYDLLGRVLYEVDAMGYVTGYSRNAYGDATSLVRFGAGTSLANATVTTASQAVTRVQVEAVVNGAGFDHTNDRILLSTYDRAGRVIETSEPSGYVYDPAAAAGLQTGTVGKRTLNTYDAFGQLVQARVLRNAATDTWATTTHYFDLLGRETGTIDALGYLTRRSYDTMGNLAQQVEYATAVAAGWSAAGYALPASNPDDRTTDYTYDLLNRKTAESRVDVEFSTAANGTSTRGTATTSYGYDALGNQTLVTDANNQSTYTYYDALGRVTAVAAPSRSSTVSGVTLTPLTEFMRDAYGNALVKVEYANGAAAANATTYTAGAADAANDRTTLTAYDSLGRAVQGTNANGASDYSSYDAYGHVAKRWQGVTGNDGVIHTVFEQNFYDKLGQLVESRTPASTSVYTNGNGISIVGQETAGVVTTAVEYNAFGEVTRKGVQGGRQEYFDYDNAGRLWRTNTGDGADKIYLYDAQGNQTAEIRSSGSGGNNYDIKGFVNAQAADANPYTRRIDTQYDLMGRVTARTEAARQELQGGVSVLRQYVPASIALSSHTQQTEAGVPVGAVNRVNLSWNNLNYLGSGDIKVYIEYLTAGAPPSGTGENGLPLGYDENGNPINRLPGTLKSYSANFNGESNPSGATLEWGEAAGATDVGIVAVTRVIVYKKDVNGEWRAAFDQAPGYGSNEITVAAPPNPTTGVTLQLRAAGSTGDTGWWTAGLTNFGNVLRFDASGVPAGNYEYRVTLTPANEAARVVGTGTVALTQPPLNSISANIRYGQGGVTPGIMTWDDPGAGYTQVFRYRPYGSSGAWSALSVTSTAATGNTAAFSGVDTSGLAADTYQYELLWIINGQGVPTSHATGTFTVVEAIPPQWVPPVNLPQIAGVSMGGGTAGGTFVGRDENGNPVYVGGTTVPALEWFAVDATVARYRVPGGGWNYLSINNDAQVIGESGPTGVQRLLLNGIAPGTYQFEIFVGSPPTAQATGNFTIYPQSAGWYETVSVQVPVYTPVISYYQPVYETRYGTRTVYYNVQVYEYNNPVITGYDEAGNPIYARDESGNIVYNWHWEQRSYQETYSYQVEVGQTPVYATDENGNIIYNVSYVTQTQQVWHEGTTPWPTVQVTTPPYTPGYWTGWTPRQYGVSTTTAAGSVAQSTTNDAVISQNAGMNGDNRMLRPTVYQKTDRWGNVLEMTDPRSAYWKTTYKYNASNQLIQQTLPDAGGGAPVTNVYYDKLGRQVAVKDANGNVNGQVFDAGGNLVQELHADGGVVTYAYNAFGNKTRVTDAEGRPVGFAYDRMGYMLRMVRGQTGVYAASNNSLQLVDTRNLTDSWTYDQLGRKLTQTNGNNETVSYTYDLRSNVIETRQPLGQVLRNAYDTQGRKTAEVDANGYEASWTYDYFGLLTGHKDLGGATFAYTYDTARQLTQQTSSRGQSLAYTYDAAGQITVIQDWANGKTTTYAYDLSGRKLRERVVQGGYTYQDNHLAYDARGNLRDVADARAHISMEYDKAGNRTLVSTYVNYQGTSGEAGYSANKYFKYDAMNRQIVVDAVDAAGNIGTQGHAITYDKNGNRTSDTYYGAKVAVVGGNDIIVGFNEDGSAIYQTTPIDYVQENGYTREDYRYDNLNRLQSVVKDGTQIDVRYYDGADRVIQSGPAGALPTKYAEIINAGLAPDEMNGKETRINRYDANGRLMHQRVLKSDNTAKADMSWDPNETYASGWNANGYDAAGNVLGYIVQSHEGNYVNEYQTSLNRFEGYQAASTTGASTKLNPGSNTQQYDANGFLVGLTDSTQGNNNRTFVNDANGRALFVNQAGNIQRQLVVNGEVLGIYGAGVNPSNPVSGYNNNPNFANVVDFDFGYAKVSANYPSASPGAYTVRPGDTLQSMAQTAYGDSALWYRIAEANGLASNSDLKVGQTLNIPNRVSSIHNNSTTFKPYDPSEIEGDKTPNLSTPQPPKKKGSFFKKLLMIIIIIVVTIITAGAAAGFLGSTATFGAAAGTAGAVTIGGATVTAAGAAIAMGAGAAVGSIAGQLFGMAAGLQDEFSWKQVGLAAIGGAVTGGMGGWAPLGGEASSIGNSVIRAAAGNVVSQGIGVATGLQEKFDWRGVAASAVGAGVGQVVGEAFGLTPKGINGMSPGELFGKRLATGLIAGAATAVARGGKVAMQQVAVDAFGNTIGQSIAEQSTSVGSPTANPGAGGGNEDVLGAFIEMNDGWKHVSAQPTFAEDRAMRQAALNPMELPTSNAGINATEAIPNEPRTYTVKKGDSPASIARAFFGDERVGALILAASGLSPSVRGARSLQVGQVLTIPENLSSQALRAGGNLIGADTSIRMQEAEARAYALRMSGGPRGGTGVAYGDAPIESPRPSASDSWVDPMTSLSPEFGGYSGQGGVLDPSGGGRFVSNITRFVNAGVNTVGEVPLMALDTVFAAIGMATGKTDMPQLSFAARGAQGGATTSEMLHAVNPVYGLLVTQFEAREAIARGDEGVLYELSGALVGGSLAIKSATARGVGNAGNVALGVDRAQVLANIADSQAARASSNFGQFVKNEGQVQANLGIWPPNSGGYAPTYGTMLDVGMQLDRFGYPGGAFVSPLGASFESRALPPSYLDTKPYFQYEVIQPIPGVTEAKALPWFGQPGMGTQFQLPNPVQYYLENGSLKVIKQ